jgi:hypothetical protein
LTELIQVISKPSFLFTTVASNPNLRSLLDTIAESSKTDEHGDQVITNLSILQPGQQWQKAKIRLVSKIFLEPAEDESPADDNHQGLTLDLPESQPEEIKPEEIKLEEIEHEKVELEEVILEEIEKKPVSYDDSPVLDNEVSQDSSENPNGSSEPEKITTDSLFDEFDSFPSSTSSTSPSSTSLIIDEPINAQVTDDVTSSEVTEIADWSKSPSLTASSLFDDFPDMENTDDVTVRLVDDETIPLDEDQDLFNNFGFGQRSPDLNSSSASSIKMSETEEDIEAIKSRISKQNLDKLLSLIEQEDKPNLESPSISNQVSNQNTSQLNAQLNADIGAKTMERILGETALINKNEVDSVDSNGNKSSTLITLEDFWAD